MLGEGCVRRETYYLADKTFWSINLDYEFSVHATAKICNDAVNFHRSEIEEQNGFILEKKQSAVDWYLSGKVHRETSEWADPVRLMSFIPGLPESFDGKLDDNFTTERLGSLCKSGEEVFRFIVNSPVDQAIAIDYPSVKCLSFVVTFTRDKDWLPTKVRMEIKSGIQQNFEWVRSFDDWKEMEGVVVPAMIQLSGVGEAAKYEPYSLVIESIERCSLSEVEETCTMSFYGMPELRNEKDSVWTKPIVWLALSIVVIVFFSLVIRNNLKSQAK
jgi:hypothetical protein